MGLWRSDGQGLPQGTRAFQDLEPKRTTLLGLV